MLTDEEIQELMEEFEKRSQKIIDEYLQKLGEHISELGEVLPSDIHQLEQIERMNGNLDEVKIYMSQQLGMMDRQIEDVMVRCAAQNLSFGALHFGQGLTPAQHAEKRLYAAKNLSRMVSAQAKVTQGQMRNLSQTTILSNSYRKCVDTAIQAVQTGMKDYNSAMRTVMKQAGREGLRVKFPNSSRTVRLDTAVRQNVLDGVRSLNQHAAIEVGEIYGADGVEISAHPLCAEDHVEDQGTQKTKAEFDDLQNSLPREFGQWNCKHFVFPIVLGVSTPAYTKEQLEEYKKNSREEIEIDGVTHSRYEWSQKMRALETKARYIGDEKTLAKASGDKTGVKQANAEFKANIAAYDKICAATGIKPEYSRMRTTSSADSNFTGVIGRNYTNGETPQTSFVGVRTTTNGVTTTTVNVPQNVQNVAQQTTNSSPNNATIQVPKNPTVEKLEASGIAYNPVSKLNAPRTDAEIIAAISGGDMTKGSCVSVALSYCGQRAGYDVEDYRGGKSADFFSLVKNAQEMYSGLGVKVQNNDSSQYYQTTGNQLLKQAEKGHEYIFSCGRHCAVVRRREDGTLQYLELQSKYDWRNGWQDFDNVRQTLGSRFGGTGRYRKANSYMVDVEEFKGKDDFAEILGYINTNSSDQKKGDKGGRK